MQIGVPSSLVRQKISFSRFVRYRCTNICQNQGLCCLRDNRGSLPCPPPPPFFYYKKKAQSPWSSSQWTTPSSPAIPPSSLQMVPPFGETWSDSLVGQVADRPQTCVKPRLAHRVQTSGRQGARNHYRSLFLPVTRPRGTALLGTAREGRRAVSSFRPNTMLSAASTPCNK
jgi:hypothetical protein